MIMCFLTPIQIEQLQEKINRGEYKFPTEQPQEKLVIEVDEVEWPWVQFYFIILQ